MILVSRVPTPPFYLLISVNVAFVLLGIVLAVIAGMTTWEGRQAQYCLTIAGIVADMFERDSARKETSCIEQLFGEYHGKSDTFRVGMDRTSKGGFAFSTLALGFTKVESRESSVKDQSQGDHDTCVLMSPRMDYEYPERLQSDISIDEVGFRHRFARKLIFLPQPPSDPFLLHLGFLIAPLDWKDLAFLEHEQIPMQKRLLCATRTRLTIYAK